MKTMTSTMRLFRHSGVKNNLTNLYGTKLEQQLLARRAKYRDIFRKMLIDYVSTALFKLFLPCSDGKYTSCGDFSVRLDKKI